MLGRDKRAPVRVATIITCAVVLTIVPGGRTSVPSAMGAMAKGPFKGAGEVPPGSVLLEVEDPSVLQTTHGKSGRQDMRDFGKDWGADARVLGDPLIDGAFLRLTPKVEAQGRYQVVPLYTTAPDHGILAGLPPPTTVDGYSPDVHRAQKSLTSKGQTPPGIRTDFQGPVRSLACIDFDVGLPA